MSSIIRLNDTLQITREQGFPKKLDLARHKQQPLHAEDFAGKVFTFTGKDGIRLYQAPPVRNFLVENRDGKWIYWGLIHITEIRHDYVSKTTSGSFKLIYIYTPEEMAKAHELIDRNPKTQYAS